MLAGVGCSGTAPSVPERTASLVEACLQSVKLPVTHVPRGTTLIDSLRPRPVTLLSVADLLQGAPAQPGALIALYSTDAAANGVFGWLQNKMPVLKHSNVIVLFLITPQPTPSIQQRIGECAFGTGARPSTGELLRTSKPSAATASD